MGNKVNDDLREKVNRLLDASLSHNMDTMIQSIIDNTDAVIYLKDILGRYILVNAKYEDLFNITKETLLGKTDFDIFPYDIALKFSTNDQRVMELEEAVLVEEVSRFQGIERVYLSNKFPVLDNENKMIGVCGISTDITEILSAKSKIEKSEHEFRTLVSNIQGVVYRCAIEKDWEMYVISDYIYQLSGYPANDFYLNQKRTYASIIHPDDLILVEKAVYDALVNRKSYIVSYRIIHKDHGIRWVHEKGVAYYDPKSNKAIYLDGVIVDITAEKKLEKMLETKNQELGAINNDLELRIEERTKTLKEANSKLENTIKKLENTQSQLIESRKMTAIGSLVKGICHELNTPLGASLTLNTFIDKEIKKYMQKISTKADVSEELLAFLENLSEYTKNNINYTRSSIEITDNLLKMSENHIVENKIFFDIGSYLGVYIDSLMKEIAERGIQIEFTCQSDLMITSYPMIISQILMSLIRNSEVHGFKERESGLITINISSHGEDILIDYKDDGVGLEREELSKIFDPFYTTKMGQFSGLGLYMVYINTVQKLGGAIQCESVFGSGMSFKIVIPK